MTPRLAQPRMWPWYALAYGVATGGAFLFLDAFPFDPYLVARDTTELQRRWDDHKDPGRNDESHKPGTTPYHPHARRDDPSRPLGRGRVAREENLDAPPHTET